MQKYINHSLSARVALSALLGSTLLSSCGGNTAPSNVTVTAHDYNSGRDIPYTTTTAFIPLGSPLADSPQDIYESQALAEINNIRKQGGTCPNGHTYAGTNPIQFEGHLHKSAKDYANYLEKVDFHLENNPESHTADGNLPVQRMVNAGYKPGSSSKTFYFAESLADDDLKASEMINLWKKSQAHCETLFDPNLNWGSVAHSNKVGGKGFYYWVFNVASF